MLYTKPYIRNFIYGTLHTERYIQNVTLYTKRNIIYGTINMKVIYGTLYKECYIRNLIHGTLIMEPYIQNLRY